MDEREEEKFEDALDALRRAGDQFFADRTEVRLMCVVDAWERAIAAAKGSKRHLEEVRDAAPYGVGQAHRPRRQRAFIEAIGDRYCLDAGDLVVIYDGTGTRPVLRRVRRWP